MPNEPIAPIPTAKFSRPAAARLGASLFADPRLSRAGDRSCMSCHDVRSNGATNRGRDLSPDGRPLERNTITVFNAFLSFRFGWLGDTRSLEAQAEEGLLGATFMGGSWDEILRMLRSDDHAVSEFRDAYGRDPDREGVLDALGAYERTLLTPDSRFDLWLRGDAGALSERERDGYRLFKSAGCVSCHQGVNIGGNLFERSGIFHQLLFGRHELVRVPSLRNVAVTAPYFDDGSAQTLEEAVNRMAEAQLGRKLTPNQTGQIVAFLKTLTGRYQGRFLTVKE
jgi:cytochrome c peroxidase